MSVISSEFQAHLDGAATTLCFCWALARRDGAVFGFTDHDRPLTVDGIEHEPETGFAASETRAGVGLSTERSDVEAALSSEQIAAADIDSGLWDGAEVTTRLVNWSEPSQALVLRRAVIGRMVREDGRFRAELESPNLALDKPSGRTCRRGCDAEVGDPRCGVNLLVPAFRGTGTVDGAPDGPSVMVAGLDGFAAGWFTGGVLSWEEGGATIARRIALHTAGQDGVRLLVENDAPGLVAGTAIVAVAGCDKRFETCRTKFANSPNFRGFPHLPGNDAAYGYARDGQVFDGGTLTP